MRWRRRKRRWRMEALHRSPSPRPEGGSSRRRGGFVFLRSPSYPPPAEPPPRYSSALALAEPPPREPPSSCAGPFTLLPPSLPLYPPCVLSRATPLLILLQTGSIPSSPASRRHPRADPREVRWSDTRQCVYVR